mmetsp:Transcript_80885/g.143265  ORF Transcript_80885/g.143265 Transcript_80885/m.143265 type:complete len:153 (+) Transcript_80885:222-680(+)
MAVMVQKTPALHRSSASSIVANVKAKILQPPAGTLCPLARGLSPQHCQEQTPRLCAAKSCFPCLLKHMLMPITTCNEDALTPKTSEKLTGQHGSTHSRCQTGVPHTHRPAAHLQKLKHSKSIYKLSVHRFMYCKCQPCNDLCIMSCWISASD